MFNTIDGVAQQLPRYTVKNGVMSLHTITLKQDLRQIISDLEKVLADPIIKYDITFSKKSYRFKEPLDDQEKQFYAQQRKQLIKAMLKKAINKFIDNHYKYEIEAQDEDYNDDSFDLIQHIICNHPTDFYVSVPSGESYEVKVEDINREVTGDAKPCKCYRFENADIKVECERKCNVVSENK